MRSVSLRHDVTTTERPAGPVIRVLYFAALKDLLGTDEEMLASPADGATVRTLVDELVTRHPVLARVLPQVRFAVNQAFVELDHPVGADDTIALLPPLGGG